MGAFIGWGFLEGAVLALAFVFYHGEPRRTMEVSCQPVDWGAVASFCLVRSLSPHGFLARHGFSWSRLYFVIETLYLAGLVFRHGMRVGA